MSSGTQNPPDPGKPLPDPVVVRIESPVTTRVTPAVTVAPGVRGFWTAVKSRTAAIDFTHYFDFINRVLCQERATPDSDNRREGECSRHHVPEIESGLIKRRNNLLAPLHGVDAYQLLRASTEAFLLMECGVFIEEIRDENGERTGTADGLEESRLGEALDLKQIRKELSEYLEEVMGVRVLPYLKAIVNGALSGNAIVKSPYCLGILRSRLACPCLLELIWSYWHEESMLVQTVNSLSLRFQNKRREDEDPLAHLEIDPLRPLGNLLWGFIQDEPNRLTLSRRAYEYDHHYGLRLYGRAAPRIRSADSRSKFLEAFHNLLYLCSVFFKDEADTMVIPDGFPLLNALKEVNLLCAEGMHNQYGDLPWTSRVEMLMVQYLLARPEIRDFLRGRPMVPYTEPWMAAVDAMKSIQSWNDTSVTHFRNLAVFGEQILLAVRFGDWNDEVSDDVAKAWAHYFKPEIQGYIHSYRAATGADLSLEPVDYRMPAALLQQRARRPRGLR